MVLLGARKFCLSCDYRPQATGHRFCIAVLEDAFTLLPESHGSNSAIPAIHVFMMQFGYTPEAGIGNQTEQTFNVCNDAHYLAHAEYVLLSIAGLYVIRA